MKIAQVTNFYRAGFGGEFSVFHFLCRLLADKGHTLLAYTRDSRDLLSTVDKMGAFFSGIYSYRQKREFRSFLRSSRPDIVHVHNVYPLLSPSILESCKEERVPVVFQLHNYNLTCPIGLHYRNGAACTRCLGGAEYWGVLKNCTGSLAKSLNYSLRTAYARRLGLFRDNVTLFMALSQFARDWFVCAGIEETQIRLLPNAVRIPPQVEGEAVGDCVGFAGRLEALKGVEIVIACAKRLPHVRFEIAGEGPLLGAMRDAAPSNVVFLGVLDAAAMPDFYRRCRCLLFPTQVFEGGRPLVVLEAMAHRVPVVGSRLGSTTELIQDGEDGFLCDPRDIETFSDKVDLLWRNEELTREFGKTARARVKRDYDEHDYYERLMGVYEDAIARLS